MTRPILSRLVAVWAALAALHCTSEAWIGGDDFRTNVTIEPDASPPAPDAGAAFDAARAVPDLSGPFGLLVRAGQNGCAFGAWTEGGVSYADATLSQVGSRVSAEVQGWAVLTFGLLLGTTTLEGELDGPSLELRGRGVTVYTVDGGCPYPVDATLTAHVDGDALEDGIVVFERNFGGAAACDPFRCTSVEALTGLRSTAAPAGDR